MWKAGRSVNRALRQAVSFPRLTDISAARRHRTARALRKSSPGRSKYKRKRAQNIPAAWWKQINIIIVIPAVSPGPIPVPLRSRKQMPEGACQYRASLLEAPALPL